MWRIIAHGPTFGPNVLFNFVISGCALNHTTYVQLRVNFKYHKSTFTEVCTIFLLATDLDGTFLGGRQADRFALYRALRNTDNVKLVFVTGRGVETVLPLLSDPLIPNPDYIISDVGGTVLEAEGLTPVQPIQWEIEDKWVGVEPIMDVLRGLKGLKRQSVPQERRCSFYLEDTSLIPEIERRVASLNCDVLHSADMYLDILPKDVSKGTTLTKLIKHIGYPPDSVLVAGDTLNDLSLFSQKFHGVAVGQSEQLLYDRLNSQPEVFSNVYRAKAPGAGGIIEAAKHFNLPLNVAPSDNEEIQGDAQLVVVYHRLPYDERVIGHQRIRREHSSPNGIIPTLLGCFEGGRQGSWVAWSIDNKIAPFSTQDLVDESRFPNLVASKIALTEDDVERFYKRFSKEAFWPVIFSFVDRANFSQSDWDHFLEINRTFAERTAREADDGALVWIHDYNLWMVPAYLRQMRPDLRIGFFHHTSFPPADVFNVIPWAGQIAGSLAQCDYVGFHIPRYVANFVDVLQSHVPLKVIESEPCAPRFRVHGVALALTEMPTKIEMDEKTLSIGAHPVGVNVGMIHSILESPESQAHYSRIRESFKGQKMILSIERLDYVKGPLQKIEAFEALLERYEDLREKVTLVLVTTPPAPGMEVYEEIREAVDETVGRINGRFRTLDWTPIHYLFRTLPFEEVAVYSAAADIAWITPLRDGLNLVAKEYVVAQDAMKRSGVLLLSEFAGASVELHGAVLTNPYDKEALRDNLYHALHLSEEERQQRMRRLTRSVEQHDVDAWSRDFLRSLEAASPEKKEKELEVEIAR